MMSLAEGRESVRARQRVKERMGVGVKEREREMGGYGGERSSRCDNCDKSRESVAAPNVT